MNCHDALRLLNDYVDAALPPADFTRTESHIGECNWCATVFVTTQIVMRIYQGLEACSLPEGFPRKDSKNDSQLRSFNRYRS
jgi:anti-sigma factor RsiW